MEWFSEWPDQPGKYWFYGTMFGDDLPSIYLVNVVKTSNSIAYIAEGHFIYKYEGAKGVWMLAILPELPKS